MLISVIVPIYNVEKYLRRCINSILAQTYQKFELILVDDGSPDNSGKICDEYANIDDRIVVIHKKNGGLSDARNAGLDVAKGDYVIFIDSDDYIEYDLFQNGIEILKDNPTGLLFYGFVIENENQEIKYEFLDKINDSISFSSESDKASFIINELLDYRVSWNAWSKFYNRDIIEANDLRFEDNKKIFAEDMYFNLCYLPFVERIICLNKPMYHYLERSDSIMGNETKKCNTDRFEKLTEAVRLFYDLSKETQFLLEYYPLIYYKVLQHAISQDIKLYPGMSFFESKIVVDQCIKRKDLFKRYINIAWRKRRFLHPEYISDGLHEERLSYLKYLCDNSLWKYRLRNRIIYIKYKR